eukprot:363794-Chlamydomonas_euryale.AAC.5
MPERNERLSVGRVSAGGRSPELAILHVDMKLESLLKLGALAAPEDTPSGGWTAAALSVVGGGKGNQGCDSDGGGLAVVAEDKRTLGLYNQHNQAKHYGAFPMPQDTKAPGHTLAHTSLSTQACPHKHAHTHQSGKAHRRAALPADASAPAHLLSRSHVTR